MADPRFYRNKGPFTLRELAEIGQCEIRRGDPTLSIRDVAPLSEADSMCLGVLHNTKYHTLLEDTKAAVCVLTEDMAGGGPQPPSLLFLKKPPPADAPLSSALFPKKKKTKQK